MDIKNPDEMIRRIGGYLHRVVPVVDATGKVLDYALKPLMVEFKPRDMMQVVVGASLLSIPVAFTEETWVLGQELPLANVIALSALSLLFVGLFVYYNFYRFSFRGHVFAFIKRVAAIYLVSLLIVALLLTIIDKCPWSSDYVTAIKRILIVAFPASMSAAVSDSIK
ncbi:MAG: DUF2391 family protein [Kiritimatiellaceae bacterium]|nr:DUF2391 family protein [Kiritimatiellaceae bacterium]